MIQIRIPYFNLEILITILIFSIISQLVSKANKIAVIYIRTTLETSLAMLSSIL